MPKAIIELTCEECQSLFTKKKAEHVRTVRRGYRQFCSRKCGDAYKKKNGKEFVGHLQEWATSDANRENITRMKQKQISQADPFREFLRRARGRKLRNGIALEITLEQIKEIWSNQNGVCPYTGWKLELPAHHQKKNPKTASLDRIDSGKGYTIENIHFVSVMANYAKSDFSSHDMIQFCQAIKKHTTSD